MAVAVVTPAYRRRKMCGGEGRIFVVRPPEVRCSAVIKGNGRQKECADTFIRRVQPPAGIDVARPRPPQPTASCGVTPVGRFAGVARTHTAQ